MADDRYTILSMMLATVITPPTSAQMRATAPETEAPCCSVKLTCQGEGQGGGSGSGVGVSLGARLRCRGQGWGGVLD